MLFEISFEVANKIGGIHTVLSKKARFIQDRYGNDYHVIGPFFENKAKNEFSPEEMPLLCKECSADLETQGIRLYYGRWLVPGLPRAILIDFQSILRDIGRYKYEYWQRFGIDSLHAPGDFDEPLAWSIAVGMLLKTFAKHYQKEFVAHCHEWLAGGALLWVSDEPLARTIFTTHATVVGRSLGASNFDFSRLAEVNADQKAYELHVEAKHQLEKKTAQTANYFTTISDLTARECEIVLGRKPDCILPNGLDFSSFPTIEELAIKHRKNREAIYEFLSFYFSPYYHFDLKNAVVYFIVGRGEIRNKGIDVYIRALGRMNQALKQTNPSAQVIAFIWVPGLVKSINPAVLENIMTYRSLEEKLAEIQGEIKSRLIHVLTYGETLRVEDLFDEETYLTLRQTFSKIKKTGSAPISTHVTENDQIEALIREAGLTNAPNDPVKVIYYPIYLTGSDGLLNLTYEEALIGSHLGVFPSLYEPWGYTPLETAASGVSAVTTDLSGFGIFIEKHCELNPEFPGIYILKRYGRKDEEIVSDLSDTMAKFAAYSKGERVADKLEARRLAEQADWRKLIENYFNLYALAGKR